MACTIIHVCDHCSDRIASGDRVSLKGLTGPSRHKPPIDLCTSCWVAMLEWLEPAEPAKSRGRQLAAAG